jgi:hypothetical protein
VSARRIVFGYVTLLAACVGLAFTTLMLMFLALLTFAEDGFICPDGGEEVWTRPGVLNYVPPVLAGIGLTVFVAWRLRRRLRRMGAAGRASPSGGFPTS